MNHANSMHDPKSGQSALQRAIAYADWIFGGPTPDTTPRKQPSAQTPSANFKPSVPTAFSNAPCLLYGERVFPFTAEMTLIGREPKATIHIDESFSGWETVSLCHARLICRNGRWLVRDGYTDTEPSENGVYVNGKRTRVNYLADYWTIGFGTVTFRFYASVNAAQQANEAGLSNALICVDCGGVNVQDARFCKKCGHALVSMTSVHANVGLVH